MNHNIHSAVTLVERVKWRKVQLEKKTEIREKCMFPKGERPSDKIFNKIFFCTLSDRR